MRQSSGGSLAPLEDPSRSHSSPGAMLAAVSPHGLHRELSGEIASSTCTIICIYVVDMHMHEYSCCKVAGINTGRVWSGQAFAMAYCLPVRQANQRCTEPGYEVSTGHHNDCDMPPCLASVCV